MSVDTMRWLDRWLGVPLCFLASFLARWRGVVRPWAGRRPRRVLCIQLAEMGSLVLAAPAVHWLETQGAKVWFVCFARNAGCLAAIGQIPEGRAFLWRTESPTVFAIDFARFIRWAWRQGFDSAVDFEPCARFSALLGWLSGARWRSGYLQPGAYRGGLHNRAVAYRPDRHMAENCLSLATALFAVGPPPLGEAEATWRSTLTPLEPEVAVTIETLLVQRFGGAARSRLLLLNPNAGDLVPQRRWPTQRWIDLARGLLSADEERCIGVVGSAAEAMQVEKLVAAVGSPRCANLAGAVSLEQLPSLFARSSLLVSNDSGPAHLAALAATPTLVLFGPETPGLYRPLGDARVIYAALPCSPCIRPETQRRSACVDNRCMQAIGLEEVLQSAERLLAGEAGLVRRVAAADS